MFEKSNCVKFEHLKKQKTGITSHLQFHSTDLSSLHLLNVHPEMHSIFCGEQTFCKPLSENAHFSTFFIFEKSN